MLTKISALEIQDLAQLSLYFIWSNKVTPIIFFYRIVDL